MMSTNGDHLERLSSTDASFLTNEHSSSHMHIGGCLLFEGPPPRYVDFVEHVRSKLDQVPRFRQRLVVPPLEAGRPLWADDVNFNLSYHIRHTALPEPGGEAQLKRLTGRVFSQQLDRSKPLWELWVVEGLADRGFALISKTHHAMVDGISGLDILSVLFAPDEADGADSWKPRPAPSYSARPGWLTTQPTPRAASAGADSRSPSASTRSEASEGVALGVQSLEPGSSSPNRTVKMSTPEIPSTSAWCVFVKTAKRSSDSPSTSHISHSGFSRLSRSEKTRPASTCSSYSLPGEGSAVARTWYLRSNDVSSTHTGRPCARGTVASRCR